MPDTETNPPGPNSFDGGSPHTGSSGDGPDPGAGSAQPAASPPTAPAAEVVIEKLVYGGSGLARLGGRVLMAPFVLPGEKVRISISGQRQGFAQGAVEQVLTPAEGRVDPACPFFYRCGGCHYQHARYPVQLEQKKAILAETLQRIGKVAVPSEIPVVSAEPWGYRNRTQFHIQNRRVGFFGFGTHELVSVDRCPISSQRINETLAALRDMVYDRRWPPFVRSIELFTNGQAVQLEVRETDRPVARRFFEWCAERMPGFAPASIDYPVNEERYRVSRGSFFQVNRHLAGRLVELALEGAVGSSALDLYAGVGLFSLPLARRFGRVDAVESGAAAARDLEHNLRRAGLAAVPHRAQAEAYLEARESAPDFVLADPPRAGLGKSAVRSLLRLSPARIHIVSCDPATLARDLAALLAGGYELEHVALIDLFPQTFHIESIARLVRKS